MTKYTSFLLIAFVFAFSGCSIKYSFSGASIPPEAQTVSVANFPNMAPLVNPTLSNTLTEALKDRFLSQTNLQLISSYGDLQFEGSIVGYKTAPVNIQANSDAAAQNRLTIAVKVKFTNLLDPEANYETKFSRYAEYDSSQSLADVESGLVEQIVEELIEDIFNKAVVNW